MLKLDCLGDFLKSCKSGTAVKVEQLDGFFAALIARPEATVMCRANTTRRPSAERCRKPASSGSLDEATSSLVFGVRLTVGRVLECDFARFRSTRTGTRWDTCLARIFRYSAVPASLVKLLKVLNRRELARSHSTAELLPLWV